MGALKKALNSASPGAIPSGAPDTLEQIRARLATRQSPVNPPEAKVEPTALDRTTRETADGGAEAISAVAAEAPPAAMSVSGAAEMTRGQKAAATRAANRARVPSATAPAPAAEPADPALRIAEALERIATVLETRAL